MAEIDRNLNQRFRVLSREVTVDHIQREYDILVADNTEDIAISLQSHKIVSRLDNLAQSCSDDIKKAYFNIPELEKTPLVKHIPECICGREFFQDLDGTMKCICGIEGFNEEYVYEDDARANENTKKNSYEDHKHSDTWLFSIQGYVRKPIPLEVIKSVKYELRDMGIYTKDQVSYEQVRECLKARKLTMYNSQIPAIIESVTGQSIPKLTMKESQLVQSFTSRALKLLKEQHHGNSPYHPYIIMKIIEHILPETTEEELTRKCQIIEFFHKQTSNTIKQEDDRWEKICPSLGIDFVSTNIHRYRRC